MNGGRPINERPTYHRDCRKLEMVRNASGFGKIVPSGFSGASKSCRVHSLPAPSLITL